MPIYAYKCESCGFAKDVLQKMSDPLLTVCPNCGKPSFTKQVTAAGFQLKGSGWYVTDFRNPAGANGAPAAAPGAPAAAPAADGSAPAPAPAAAQSPAPAATSSDAAPAAPAPAKTTPPASS